MTSEEPKPPSDENTELAPATTPEGDGKPKDPFDTFTGVAAIAWVVVLAVYLLHQAAVTLFPADSKTLARDAVITGFFGAALLVQELVRQVTEQIPRIVIVALVFGAFALIPAGLRPARATSLPLRIAEAFALVVILSVAYKLGEAVVNALPNRGRLRAGVFASRAGLVLGLLLLVLSLFLQLRAIDLTSATRAITPAPQGITFTSTPPAAPAIRATYTATATGGASGHPVRFSIDPASTAGACTISAGTVTFTGAGSCVINADQSGNQNYLAAPQAQQTLTITAVPRNTSPPTLTDTPRTGRLLTCLRGGWTGNPTSYAYQWSRDGTPIQGDTGRTYPVQILDQGSTLTCTMTAANPSGASLPATSNAVTIAVPHVAGCPKETGRVAGQQAGALVARDDTRASAPRRLA